MAIGGMPDHVHILLSLSKKHALVTLVQEIKKVSSVWMKEQPDIRPDFYWQNGYGAFSVSPGHIERVKRYIANQKRHHKDTSFKEEYVGFLKEYNADYDERYVWD
jgi:putative transposase